MNFSWKKFLVREYNQTFIWLAAAILVTLKNFYYEPRDISFQESLPYLIGIFAVLVVAYLTIRFLKKTKRLTYN
jgi:hypothetical protein